MTTSSDQKILISLITSSRWSIVRESKFASLMAYVGGVFVCGLSEVSHDLPAWRFAFIGQSIIPGPGGHWPGWRTNCHQLTGLAHCDRTAAEHIPSQINVSRTHCRDGLAGLSCSALRYADSKQETDRRTAVKACANSPRLKPFSYLHHYSLPIAGSLHWQTVPISCVGI